VKIKVKVYQINCVTGSLRIILGSSAKMEVSKLLNCKFRNYFVEFVITSITSLH